MKKIAFIFILTICVYIYGCAFVNAEWTPIQLAVWEPAQIFDEYVDVYGLRLTLLYGKNAAFKGVDIGAGVNLCKDEMKGIQVAG